MAQAALTLSELTGGRFTLGLGVSHRASMEGMLGLSLHEPLAVMREYVAVLRGAVGGTAAFDGRHYRVKWSLAVPERPPAPAIYLAALSRNMLELAGEIADGAVGGPEVGQSFVRAYREAGVTLPAIRPITFPDAPWYRRTLEEASRW